MRLELFNGCDKQEYVSRWMAVDDVYLRHKVALVDQVIARALSGEYR